MLSDTIPGSTEGESRAEHSHPYAWLSGYLLSEMRYSISSISSWVGGLKSSEEM